MIQQILAPLDGSAVAETALPLLAVVARLTGARVTLLGVVDPQLTPPASAGHGPVNVRLELQQAAAHSAAYLEERAAPLRAAGIAVLVQTRSGVAAEEIIASSRGADLVVMATHGRGGLGRWALGSVADAVVRGATVPVLLVRAGAGASPTSPVLQRIVVPLDGSSLAEAALPLASELAERAGAELLLVRCLGWPVEVGRSLARLDPLGGDQVIAQDEHEADAYLADQAARLAERGRAATAVRCDAAAVEGILQTVDSRAADLIVMTTHGRGGWRRLLLGSVADRIVHQSSVPILLIRASAD